MFAMLWGTTDLIASFEGFSMFPPAAQVVRVRVRVRDRFRVRVRVRGVSVQEPEC